MTYDALTLCYKLISFFYIDNLFNITTPTPCLPRRPVFIVKFTFNAAAKKLHFHLDVTPVDDVTRDGPSTEPFHPPSDATACLSSDMQLLMLCTSGLEQVV